jgi:hypothetical protein
VLGPGGDADLAGEEVGPEGGGERVEDSAGTLRRVMRTRIPLTGRCLPANIGLRTPPPRPGRFPRLAVCVPRVRLAQRQLRTLVVEGVAPLYSPAPGETAE